MPGGDGDHVSNVDGSRAMVRSQYIYINRIQKHGTKYHIGKNAIQK